MKKQSEKENTYTAALVNEAPSTIFLLFNYTQLALKGQLPWMKCKNKPLVIQQKENCNSLQAEIFFPPYMTAKQ